MLNVSNTYIGNIYADVRQFQARVTISMNAFGVNNPRVYDNETIVSMNVLEEISTLNDTLPSNELQLTMDNSTGDFDVLTYANMNSILASKPTIFCELGLVVEGTTEWLPMGKFFISEWKNEITTKVITFTANDYFRIFGDSNYEPTGITNLFDLARDVLNKAGVPIGDQIISSHLSAITVNSFKERIDSRTALQHIGIAARSTVFQDRNGKINIEPFLSLEKSSNYILYTRSQPSLGGGYAGGNTYSRVSTSGGMAYIDVDYMYDFPEVTLDRSVYQVVIKVYDYTLDPEAEPAEIIYTQGTQGSNGISFLIDNPLVNTVELGQEIVDWFFRESNYAAVYKLNWRQNPALECTDIVLIEDAFQANKQTRIYRQEFQYEGYLEGNTESRGGF